MTLQSSFVSHVDKGHALKGIIAKHNAIKNEINVLRELVEKVTTAMSSVIMGMDGIMRKKGKKGSAKVDDDHLRSIQTIVLHKLERVKEKDVEQIAKQEEEEEEAIG